MSRMTPVLALRSAHTHICRSMQHACCAVQPLCGVVEGLSPERVRRCHRYACPERRMRAAHARGTLGPRGTRVDLVGHGDVTRIIEVMRQGILGYIVQ